MDSYLSSKCFIVFPLHLAKAIIVGTLQNQPERKYWEVDNQDVEMSIERIKHYATKYKLSFEEVLRVYELKEAERRNNLYVANGDYHDEQMAGFGNLLEELNEHVRGIAEGQSS